jgi:hypothetical protein
VGGDCRDRAESRLHHRDAPSLGALDGTRRRPASRPDHRRVRGAEAAAARGRRIEARQRHSQESLRVFCPGAARPLSEGAGGGEERRDAPAEGLRTDVPSTTSPLMQSVFRNPSYRPLLSSRDVRRRVARDADRAAPRGAGVCVRRLRAPPRHADVALAWPTPRAGGRGVSLLEPAAPPGLWVDSSSACS